MTELTDLNVEDLVALVNGLVELLEPELDRGDVEHARHLHRPHPEHKRVSGHGHRTTTDNYYGQLELEPTHSFSSSSSVLPTVSRSRVMYLQH